MNNLNLFKYYKPKYNDVHNLSFYTEESIYFQKPTEFNDPWDCKAPHITCPRGNKTLKDIWFKLAEQVSPAFAKAEWQKMQGLSRLKRSQQLVRRFKEAYEGLRSKIGVFSLSFIPDSELMWSHYASSHSGYILHFQIDINKCNFDFNSKSDITPVPVIYRKEREIWKLEDYYVNRKRYAYDLIRYKSKAWAYECEFRLLDTDGYGFIKIPSNYLKSIVIGIDTDSELQDILKDIGNKLKVPVLSSVMNEKEYKINDI